MMKFCLFAIAAEGAALGDQCQPQPTADVKGTKQGTCAANLVCTFNGTTAPCSEKFNTCAAITDLAKCVANTDCFKLIGDKGKGSEECYMKMENIGKCKCTGTATGTGKEDNSGTKSTTSSGGAWKLGSGAALIFAALSALQ